jgi:ectoine hydroxylase-related dioxygenase (phytanoyl-CoA dioxygenase family)
MILTQQDRDQFDRDGFFVIEPEIPESVMEGVLADMADRYPKEETSAGGYRSVGRVQDAWRLSDNVKAVARAPKVLQILEEFYGRKPLPFQTLNFPVGTQQRVHSDAVHFHSKPAGFMCGVWLALEDMDMDNGPLVYYPGSHKLPIISMDEVDQAGYLLPSVMDRVLHTLRQLKRGHDFLPVTPEVAYSNYETFISDTIEKLNLEPRYSTIRRGQALIWATNLLHGGAPQKDPNRTRFSQVTHYYFEGCRYFCPRLSFGKSIEWRDPSWVI